MHNSYLLANHGTYWSAGELRRLVKSFSQGVDIRTIAYQHQRTETACANVYREIRKVQLMETGGDSDTLVSIKRRQLNGS